MTNGASGVDGIDWSGIHRRLEKAAADTEQKITVPPERKKAILKERAQLLARERASVPEQGTARGPGISPRREHYAVELSRVREVCPLKDFAEVPGTPPFIFGVVHVRGRIVSVIDLKRFFDLPAKGLTDLNKVIIISDDHMEFGLLADAVPGVRQVAAADLSPSLPTLTGARLDYLKGVAAGPLIVLDADKLLSDPRIKIN